MGIVCLLTNSSKDNVHRDSNNNKTGKKREKKMKNKDLDTLEGKVSRNIRRSLFTPSLSKDNIKKESNYIN